MSEPTRGGNHFELFDLTPSYEVDLPLLAERFRELQREVHPDRFAGESQRQQRQAMEQSTRINDAYQTLKSPLQRARYLLELNGISIDDTDTSMPAEFLFEQMELREALAAVGSASDPLGALFTLRDRIEAKERELVESLTRYFNLGERELLEGEAVLATRKMQFFLRLLEEVEAQEERLADQF
jgi:molecular chaperone HscB